MATQLSALPIDDFLEKALEHLKNQQNLVVTAAPGAGKTTRLPAFLAARSEGKVLVLEPRRMAAMAAAQRIADEQKWNIGQEVGYQVRFANQTSSETKLIFLTEALLSRKISQDSQLKGVEYVILDEFHERSIHVDLALGLLRELQDLGSEIKIVVMSATLDAEKISSYLGHAPVLKVPGKLFPLDIKYQKNSQLMQTGPPFYENVFAAIKEAAATSQRDILVFLPGTGEIERTSQNIRQWAEQKNIEVVPLHGSLPLDEQRKALRSGTLRRVILSTNIAESSVTVDGVGCVIDSGLEKTMRHDLRTGFSRLELHRISKASAEQRAGRAARQFSGICYRLWNKLDENSMPPHELPEILRIDLSESLLFLASQGVRDFETFSWYEKPGAIHLKKAIENLRGLGALDPSNHLTSIGQKLLSWPLPPRLAKLMLVAIECGMADLGADLAAILQERDFIFKHAVDSYIADRFENDLLPRLEILRQHRSQRGSGHHQTQRNVLQMVERSSQQIRSYCKNIEVKNVDNTDPRFALQKLTLLAFSDRLCRRRQPVTSDRGLMVGGRGVRLAPESLVRESEFFIALDGVDNSKTSETLISLAVGIDKSFLFNEKKSEITKKINLKFDREKRQFYVIEGRYLSDLCIEEGSISLAKAEDVAEHLPDILLQEWEWVLAQNEGLQNWLERWTYLLSSRDSLPTALQDRLTAFEDSLLLPEELKKEAFAMAASGERDLQSVVEKDLVYFFEALLPQEVVQYLRSEVPDRLKVPSGSSLKIQYPQGREPYLEVRIQEVFGWQETPKIFQGQRPITLHLLGPNYRPMQVTSDLQSFWQKAYPEVRKELKVRYPKHSWPEDPLTAPAVAKGRPTKA